MVPPKVFTGPFRSKILFQSYRIYLNIIIYHKLLCASKFATAKNECIFEMASKLHLGYHLFCCWWYISSLIEIISDEISPAVSIFLTTYSELGPPWCNLANRETEDKKSSSFKRRWPMCRRISQQKSMAPYLLRTGMLSLWFAVILSPSKLFMNSKWIFFSFIAEINGEII